MSRNELIAVAFFVACAAAVVKALLETSEKNLRRMDGRDE